MRASGLPETAKPVLPDPMTALLERNTAALETVVNLVQPQARSKQHVQKALDNIGLNEVRLQYSSGSTVFISSPNGVKQSLNSRTNKMPSVKYDLLIIL